MARLLRRPLSLSRPTATRGRLWKRRLWSKHLHECLVRALLVRISAAHSDRANELVIHNDRQAPSKP